MGPSSFLINYDLKGFDVPRIKRHEGAQAILRNINYLMDIIRRKLRLTVKYNFKVESIMVILTLNPLLSGPLSRGGYNSRRRKRKFQSALCHELAVGPQRAHCPSLNLSFSTCEGVLDGLPDAKALDTL